MGSSIKGAVASALPLAALLVAPLLGLGAIGTLLFVGAASIGGSIITKETTSIADVSSDESSAVDIRLNYRTTQKTLPVIYGDRRVGSNDVFIEMTGDSQKYMWIVHCIGEGICEGIAQDSEFGFTEIYLEGQSLYSYPGYESPFEGLVEWWFHSGDPDVNAPTVPGTIGGNKQVNSALNAAFPEFTDRMHYTAYMVFKIEFDTTVFTSIPRREVVVKGLRTLDFRYTSITYSRNPVLHLYDYITNSRYGLGWDSSLIETTSWSLAANYCDNHSPSWKVDYAIGSSLKANTVIDTLLSHFRGSLSWDGGKLSLYYKDISAPVTTIEDSDIARDQQGAAIIQVSQPSTHSMPNGVLVKYVSRDLGWAVDDVSIGEEDGNIAPIDFLGFSDKKLATNMGYYSLERMKLNRNFTLTLRGSNMILESGDVVQLTSKELGISGVKMRVIQSDFMPSQLVQVSLIYEQDNLYNDVLDPIDMKIYESNLADPNAPCGPVRNVVITEDKGVDRGRTFVILHITFDPPERNSVYYESTAISIKQDIDDVWSQSFRVTEAFDVNDAKIGELYTIRLSTVNIRGIIQPDNEAVTVAYRVTGYPSLPICPSDLRVTANVTSIDVYASPTNESDIEYYEFRVGQTGDFWNDSIFLTTQQLPAISYSGVKPGTHRFMLSPYRNDGKYCILPPHIDVKLEDPPPFHDIIFDHVVDYNDGIHNNTEVVNGKLRCAHQGGLLSGTFTTNQIRVEDIISGMSPSSAPDEVLADDQTPLTGVAAPLSPGVWYLAYLLFDYTVAGAAGTWNQIWPPPDTTWLQGAYPPLTWSDLVGTGDQAPRLSVELLYNDGSTSGTIGRMEILSGLFVGDLVRIQYTITDQVFNSFLELDTSILKVCDRKEAPPPEPPTGTEFLIEAPGTYTQTFTQGVREAVTFSNVSPTLDPGSMWDPAFYKIVNTHGDAIFNCSVSFSVRFLGEADDYILVEFVYNDFSGPGRKVVKYYVTIPPYAPAGSFEVVDTISLAPQFDLTLDKQIGIFITNNTITDPLDIEISDARFSFSVVDYVSS
jgi:hypothetical protein